MTYFVFLLLGLGNGAAFAALALALVVTFRSSGVVNFATGAIALYAAYTYAFLRQGKLLDPFPGLPVTVNLGNELTLVPALLLALLISAVLGVVLYLLVFRPLRKAPPVAKAVASLGLMIVVQADVATRVGTSPVSVSAIFPAGTLTINGSAVPTDRLWFAGTIVVITVIFSAFFRFTRFGLSTKAAAESERGAHLSGLSPERIAVINWALSAVVAGLTGILIAPIVPLIPVSYTLFIVPALAAALVGGFVSVVPAVGAGLLIGMLQSEMTYLQATHPSLPQSGLPELIPLVIILGYLVLRGRPLPSRGAIITQTLGKAPRPRALWLNGSAGVALVLLGLLATSGSYRAAIITSLMLALICLSLVVVTGFAGQISLAQLTLAGVAAFTLSRLTHSAGIPFPIAPLLAALAATVVGVVIGLPALRVRGLPVAVVTLALAVAVEQLWFNNTSLNGGIKGAPIESPTLFGLDLGIGSGSAFPRVSFGVMVLLAVLLVSIGVARLRISRLGAAMLAVRANERSAAAAGIDVARTKIIAFAIGAFIAGLGGALIGYSQGLASDGSFTAIGGLALFATAYMAGVTALSGGLLGGVIASGGILFIALDRTVKLGSWYETITGVGLVLTVILNPEGIVGPFHVIAAKVRRWRVGERPSVPAPKMEEEPTTVPTGQSVNRLGEVQLALRGVSVRYGGVVANNDVSFVVRKGEIVGLIGPNGAGKTTLIDAISGYTASTGSVELFGNVLNGEKPHQRVRAGLGRTFQGIELYEDLSVEENVSVGQTAARHGGTHTADDVEQAGKDTLDHLFSVLKLNEVRDRPVRELSQGRRQLVSIARALAGRPSVILLDEPAGGLDSTESQWLGHRLRAIRDAGITILMVEHDMGLVLDVCDRIVVLDLGCVIADGPPEVIQSDPAVTRAYLGTTHAHHAKVSA